MRKIVIGLLCLALFFHTGCLEKEKAMIISMKDFMDIVNNYTREINNETKYQYFNLSVEEGAVLIIRDVVHNISYDAQYNYSDLYCVTELNYSFPVGGDLTKDFKAGDGIEIKLHIIRDVFRDPYNSEWTISIEVIKEAWDDGTHKFIPISPDAISLL